MTETDGQGPTNGTQDVTVHAAAEDARRLVAAGDFAAAAALCAQGLAEAPEHPDLVLPHAEALVGLGRLEEAAPVALLCARLRSLEPSTYAILARLLEADGDLRLAAALRDYASGLAADLEARPPSDAAESYGRAPVILTLDSRRPVPAEEPEAGAAPLLIGSELWGGWHLDVFLNCFLPSMLCPGNLPWAGRRRPGSRLSISLPIEEYMHLRAHPAFLEAAKQIDVRISVIKHPVAGAQKYDVMKFLQNRSIGEAVAAGMIYFPLPPDTIQADRTVETAVRVLEAGDKKAFYAFSPRIELEEFARFMLSHSGGRGVRELACARRDLVLIAMACQHRTQRAMNVASEAHSIWPSSVLWTVPGQGHAVRAFHLAPIAVRPEGLTAGGEIANTIDHDYVPSDRPDHADLHVSTDSDEYFGFSFSGRDDPGVPRTQPVWYSRERVFEWLEFAGGELDLFHASHPVRIHSSDIDEAGWTAVEREGQDLIDWLRARWSPT